MAKAIKKPLKKSRSFSKDILEGRIPEDNFSIFKTFKNLFVFPKYAYKKDAVTILSCDPGISNFAYILFSIPVPCISDNPVAEIINCLKNVQTHRFGFIESCLSELRQDNLAPYINKFREDNKELFSHSSDYLVLERFQARALKGPRNEVINFNICNLINSMLTSENPVRHVRLFIPSQWKRYLTYKKDDQEIEGLQIIYDTLSADKSLKRVLKDHHVDSFLIGAYFYLTLILGARKDEVEFKVPLVEFLVANTIPYLKSVLHLYK